jgi:hypothetical protein
LAAAWGRLKAGQTQVPAQIRLAGEHADGSSQWPPLQADACYFVITIHELYLHDRRVWWQRFAPALWTSAEFSYDGQPRTVPYLIGPKLLSNDLGAPDGMLYRNIRVAGPHPYKGGPVTVSMVLNRVQTGDASASVLSILESAVSAFGLSTALAPYLTLTHAVADGFQLLLHLGSEPVLGVRDSVGSDDDFDAPAAPGYYALLDQPAARDKLWVREHQLLAGADTGTASPVRDRSYVLYSIRTTAERKDISQISDVTALWNQVEAFAQRPDRRSYQAAKALMTELGILLRRHPDFTTVQADALYRDLLGQMVDLHQERVDRAPRALEPGAAPPLDPDQEEIVSLVTAVMSL